MDQPVKLRPHHILDILRNYGYIENFTPHPFGHAQHLISQHLVSNRNTSIQLVNASDDICVPCKHLLPNGKCNDQPGTLDKPVSKQNYNDALDRKLFHFLDLTENTIITFYEFLVVVQEKIPGIENICTHPTENKQYRLKGMIRGLEKLGL